MFVHAYLKLIKAEMYFILHCYMFKVHYYSVWRGNLFYCASAHVAQ